MTFHFLQQTTWILRKHHEGKYSSPIIPPYQGGAVSYFLQVLSHLLICPTATFHSSISHLHLHHCSRLAQFRTTRSRLCQFSNLRFSKTQLKLVKTVKHSIISQLYQPGQTIADITAFQRHFQPALDSFNKHTRTQGEHKKCNISNENVCHSN